MIDLRKIIVGNIYTYKELCIILGEKVKGGDSKKAQLARWRECYFDWENPTTQKFLITKVYDSPKEHVEKRGGYRKNAGSKSDINEEFEYLFNCFLQYHWHLNSYNVRSKWKVAYFTSSHIMEYFGLRKPNFYKAKEDGRFTDAMFSKMCDKLNEKLRRWILDKIDAIDGIELKYGIIAYKDKYRKQFDYRDDFLDEWEERYEKYLEDNNLRNMKDVVDKELYVGMIAVISANFKGYHSVIRTRKIDFQDYKMQEYEVDDIEEYRKRLNRKLVKSLVEYFKKYHSDNLQKYKDMIIDYVLI